MAKSELPGILLPGGLFGVLVLLWLAYSITVYNSLSSLPYVAFCAYLAMVAACYPISVTRASLVAFFSFGLWVIYRDLDSLEPWPALAKDTHWLAVPVATLLLGQVFRRHKGAVVAVKLAAAIAIVVVLLAFQFETGPHTYANHAPVFGQVRHLGLSIGFLAICLYLPGGRGSWLGVVFRGARILGLAIMFWSGTRSSILAWLFCMLLLAIAERTLTRVLVVDTALAIGLALIPISPMSHRGLSDSLLASIDAQSIDGLSARRLSLWQSTLAALNQLGLIWQGAGGNGFLRIQKFFAASIYPPGHLQPHNFIIQVVCDWGLIGLVLISALFGRMLSVVLRYARSGFDPVPLAAIIYLAITGMLDATLYNFEHLVYLTTALAMVFGALSLEGNGLIRIPKAATVLLLVTLVLPHVFASHYLLDIDYYFRTK